MPSLTDTPIAPTEDRIARLSTASLKRVIEPDVDVPGEVGPGQVLPDELLTVAGLDLGLTAEQRAVLSREEAASITDSGIRFESVLAAGFSMEIVRQRDLTATVKDLLRAHRNGARLAVLPQGPLTIPYLA